MTRLETCTHVGKPTGKNCHNYQGGRFFDLPVYSCAINQWTHERQCDICTDYCRTGEECAKPAVRARADKPLCTHLGETVTLEGEPLMRECPSCGTNADGSRKKVKLFVFHCNAGHGEVTVKLDCRKCGDYVAKG